MRSPFCVLAAAMLVLALGACGESSEDKAQTAVCDARADIGKQVDTLTSLTPATVTTDAVTQSLDAIKKDLSDMSNAQSELSSDRRSEVEAANKAFTSSVKGITSELLKSVSASDAKSALVTALQQLKTSYASAFEPLDCS
jgi:Tfp pilus assembly protein PilP